MEEKRVVSVNELIRKFVTISYLQEQRIFDFSSIYKFIDKWCEYCADNNLEREFFPNLIDEAQRTIENLLNEEIISFVYPDGSCGMYRVLDKVDFMELANYDKEYISDMVKIFL